MGTLRESIYKELIVRYKKEKIRDYLYKKDPNLTIEAKQELEPEVDKLLKAGTENQDLLKDICGFVLVEYSDSYDISALTKLKNDAKRHGRKSFHIVDIERIHSEMITNFSFGVSLKKTNKYTVQVSDTTGLFKVVFSNGAFMYYSKWISGGGKTRSVEGMYAAEREVWLEFLKMMKIEKKKNARPKNGIYRIMTNGMGILEYKKLDNLQETPIIHPSTDILLQDINYYYSNVALFTRFGMSGVRKGLMVGPPGTGKTSLAVKIAKKFEHEKCVVFSTSIQDIALHLVKCAEYKVSTLAILEDAEATLKNANSALLNFLDGVDQPKNLLGSYVIMTTNHPDQIEPRILKRPGRVDKIIEFGNLFDQYAVKCAEIYFEEILFNDSNRSDSKEGKSLREKLFPHINNMSGAEIKELAQASAAYAASSAQDVDVALIKETKRIMRENIQSISKYAAEQSSISRRPGIGFTSGDDSPNTFKEDFLMPTEAY